jgi:hypothetical protein
MPKSFTRIILLWVLVNVFVEEREPVSENCSQKLIIAVGAVENVENVGKLI